MRILSLKLCGSRIKIAKPQFRLDTERGGMADPAIGGKNACTGNLAFQAIGHNQIAAEEE